MENYCGIVKVSETVIINIPANTTKTESITTSRISKCQSSQKGDL